MLTLSGYLAGVERGRREGLIVGAPKEDLWNPIHAGIRPSNSRFLTPALERKVLDLPKGASVLELGPGAGIGVMHLHHLRPDLKIDTVSLTPLSPYHLMEGEAIERALQASRRDLMTALTQTFEQNRICFKNFMSKGHLVPSDAPYVRRQYIGNLQEFSTASSYDLIFEQLGPLYHSSPKARHEILDRLITHLSPEGEVFVRTLLADEGIEERPTWTSTLDHERSFSLRARS